MDKICNGLNNDAKRIHENAVIKGFWDKKRETGTLLMLCVSELSEAMEADRKDKHNMLKVFEDDLKFAQLNDENFDPNDTNYDWIVNRFETTIKDTFEDELADTIIRLLDLCGSRGIDIEKHINLKLKYNYSRKQMHGKKY
jgi:NTP pyrophosphatase (non-canonical NTP hydrolase)